MNPTLHVLANPNGISAPRYRMEPFNQAVIKFVRNMTPLGWNIVHYGHQSSEIDCENVTCVTNQELPPPADGDLFMENHELQNIFTQRAITEIASRKKTNDMILCFFGTSHQAVAAQHQDLKIIEPSIGYRAECVFAPFRAFTSYAQMHYFYGQNNMLLTPSWYDAVIPNAFTPSEFEYRDSKTDYFVYLGRITPDKGIDIAIQTTAQLGIKLIVAGPGNLADLGYSVIPQHVDHIGYVNPEQRKSLLSQARCLMAPTHYIEPFGNIIVESYLSGTPVIATDWGGFVDTVVNGVTGYRCRDFGEFIQAAIDISKINPAVCRKWAIDHYSDTVVHQQFDKWLHKIHRNDFYHV